MAGSELKWLVRTFLPHMAVARQQREWQTGPTGHVMICQHNGDSWWKAEGSNLFDLLILFHWDGFIESLDFPFNLNA